MQPHQRFRHRLRRVSSLGALSAFASLAAARGIAAQIPTPEELACLRSVPASAYSRLPVHLVVGYDGRDEGKLEKDASRLAVRLSARVTRLLGGGADTLPHGEPRLTWATHGGTLLVTVRRDGSATWRVSRRSTGRMEEYLTSADSASLADSAVASWVAGRGAGALLLDEAMRAEAAVEPPRFAWPSRLDGDSLVLRYHFTHQTLDRNGGVSDSLPKRRTYPVFSIVEPWSEPVRELRAPPIRYPLALLERGVEGDVLLQFIVGGDGRADPATILSLASGRPPRRVHALDDTPRTFDDATVMQVRGSAFAPRRLGGCVVRQVVQKPYSFRIR